MSWQTKVRGFFSQFLSKQVVDRFFPVPAIQHRSAAWTPANFGQLAAEGYGKNEVVYACIRLLSLAGPQAVMKVGKMEDGEFEAIENHPMQELLDRPNPEMDQVELLEQTYAYQAIAGNCVWVKFRARAGNVAELWPWRPDHVKVIPSPTEFISHYQLWEGQSWIDVPKEDVIHFRHFHPLNPYWGMPPLAVGMRAADVDNETSEFVQTLLQNEAVPGGVLETDLEIDKEVRQQLEEYWQNRFGKHRRGKVAALHMGLKYKPVGLNLNELAFKDLRQMSESRICMVFAVPPIMVGAQAGLEKATYSNYGQAEQALWNETLIPSSDSIASRIARGLAPDFGDDQLVVKTDLSEVSALQEDETEKWKRANIGARGGWIRVNEARSLVGLPPDPEGEIFMRREDGTPLPAGDGSGGVGKSSPFPLGGAQKKASRYHSENWKTIYWKGIERARQAWIARGRRRMREYFDEEREEIVKAVEGLEFAAEANDVVGQILDNRSEKLFNVIFTHRMETVTHFGTDSLRDVQEIAEQRNAPIPSGKAGEFDPWDEEVQNWLHSETAKNVTHVEDTTRQKIRGVISDAHEENLGAMQAASRIDDLYLKQIIPNRSEVIARTETMQAASFGSWMGAKRAEIPGMGKFWINSRDDRVREQHADMEGHEPILIDDYFRVGNDMMRYPLDPNGSAENVIQCRCVLGYEYIGVKEEKDPLDEESLAELKRDLQERDAKDGYDRMQKHFDGAVQQMRDEGLSDKEIAEKLWGGIKGKQKDHPLSWLSSKEKFGNELIGETGYRDYLTGGQKAQMTRASKFFAEQIDQPFLSGLGRNAPYIGDWDPRFRASYSHMTREIVWDGRGKSLVHEFSHHIHHSSSGVQDYVEQFFRQRTQGHELTVIYKGTNELGFRDAFYNHYVGRFYDHAGVVGEEVLTMGMQECMTAASRAKLFARDSAHYQLTAAIARGLIPW